MFDLLAGLLAFFYDHVIHDYAAAITLLTLTVYLVLTPLTWRGTRSMLAMQRLQPEIKKLQAKHKNDRQALNEAMMAFYKEHKVNPLSGCLPQILQFPVLIVMFRVLHGLTHYSVSKTGAVSGPQYIKHSSDLYHALVAAKGHMVSLGVDLSKAAARTHGSDAIPLYILIALVGITGYWQSRQMTARNPQAAQANQQMQMMTKLFPLISVVISFNLPGGVVLYFLVSTLFRIAQQSLMYRLDPSLTAAVKSEVKEIDATAKLVEKRHRQEAPKSSATAPKPQSGRVVAKGPTGGGGSNGASGNGKAPNRQAGRRSRRRRSRGR